MNSYDLTEDNRGLALDGRLVNADLVIIRNRAYKRLHEIDIPINASSRELDTYHSYFDDIMDLIQLCDKLLES